MRISEMNKILKEMKEICKFKDDETDVNVSSKNADPYFNFEGVKLKTTINDIDVYMSKTLTENKGGK